METLILIAVVLVIVVLGLLVTERLAKVIEADAKLTLLIEALLILVAIVYLVQRAGVLR